MSKVFISQQRVYWDMLDLMGILHNARYVIMFERARFDFWSHLGAGPETPGFDWPYVVARNEVNYRSAIHTEQDVTVSVAVESIHRSSLCFVHSLIDRSGVLSAEGRTVLVRVDATSFRPVPWSDSFRTLLEPYTVTSD